jgi:hypothetical protein
MPSNMPNGQFHKRKKKLINAHGSNAGQKRTPQTASTQSVAVRENWHANNVFT